MKHDTSITIRSAVLLALALTSGAAAAGYNQATAALRMAMRANWDAHVLWTREYIVSVAAGIPDTELVAERLLKVQDGLGDLVRPYYGADAADQLSGQFKQHVRLGVAIVNAAQAGDTALRTSLTWKWHTNADSIADFLATVNPHWTDRGLLTLLKDYLRLTIAEMTDRLGYDYAASITDFDRIYTQAMKLSDALTAGIVKQFPAKFESP